jgi:hypothetical protein
VRLRLDPDRTEHEAQQTCRLRGCDKGAHHDVVTGDPAADQTCTVRSGRPVRGRAAVARLLQRRGTCESGEVGRRCGPALVDEQPTEPRGNKGDDQQETRERHDNEGRDATLVPVPGPH